MGTIFTAMLVKLGAAVLCAKYKHQQTTILNDNVDTDV